MSIKNFKPKKTFNSEVNINFKIRRELYEIADQMAKEHDMSATMFLKNFIESELEDFLETKS